jgi:hypothetical protein
LAVLGPILSQGSCQSHLCQRRPDCGPGSGRRRGSAVAIVSGDTTVCSVGVNQQAKQKPDRIRTLGSARGPMEAVVAEPDCYLTSVCSRRGVKGGASWKVGVMDSADPFG